MYDPFFKKIFNPVERRDRLSELVSCLLGQNVTVLEVFPNEDSQFSWRDDYYGYGCDDVLMEVSLILRFRRFLMIFRQREYHVIRQTLCCVSIR